MANRIFAITAARETVTLDQQGRAQVSFTVSNTSPKSLAGRAKLVALGSTKEAWLTLEGEPERKFAKGESHQFTVRIAVLPGTAAGKYAFRLNIISVENPDDEFTEGPSVSLEVKELAPAAPPPRKFPWWIIAVAAVVIVGAGLITWLLIPQNVTVPDMVGKSYEDAVKRLEVAKLKLASKSTKTTGTQKPGIVIEQNPKANAVSPVGSGVTLVVEVAPKTIPVPDVVGKPVSEAKKLLKDFTSHEVGQRITGKFSPGLVVEQNPPKDTNVAPGEKVTLIVEANSVEVPDVIGKSVGQAFEDIRSRGLKDQYKLAPNRGIDMWATVVWQSPEPLARVAPGGTVTFSAEHQ